ncbi:MAG: AEC family transporter, partial [Succinivibrio sp.]
MSESVINAYTVLLIFATGYLFKRHKIITLETARKLSYIIMYVTLPCAILAGTSGPVELEAKLFFIVPIAFLISFALPFLGYVLYRKEPDKCVYAMLNLGGFNIGNFILPFMQSVMSTEGFLALCLFDVINAFFCFGGVYCMALWFNRKGFNNGEKIDLKRILKELSKSVTSYCCILSVVLSACSVTLPEAILHPVKVIGASNTFICMFIIGVALNFDITFAKIKRILMMIFYRYSAALVMAVAVWFLLPFSSMVRLVIIAIIFAPITSLAPITAIRSLP